MNNSLTDIETKEFLLSIIGNSPIGKIVIDMRGHICVINDSALDLLGLTKSIDLYLNQHILELTRGISLFEEKINDCILNGRRNFKISEVKVGDKYLNIIGQTTLNGMLIIFEDLTSIITSRKALELQSEELHRRNKELMEFNHITSHDLQEPLRNILGFSNLLTECSDDLSEEARGYVKIISGVAENMSKKISELLEYSRLGRMSEKEDVCCSDLINEVKLSLKSILVQKKVNLKHEVLPIVNGYKNDLYSLFQNLISNAVKFHHYNKPVEINISVDDHGDYWRFSVKDNGIGIDTKHQGKIFNVFQRLHNSKEFEGTGVGLALCKKITEIHHGRIWVNSKLGEGSNFLFTLKK